MPSTLGRLIQAEDGHANRLLARLPADAQAVLTPHLKHIELGCGAVLETLGEPTAYVHFPAGGTLVSLQQTMQDGTGVEVADQMEEWFGGNACDGFVIAATHSPGAYEDVVRLVVPELQKRGVFRDRYAGATLRENLGLARPEWKAGG